MSASVISFLNQMEKGILQTLIQVQAKIAFSV
jgi:hypothetical protein